MVEDSEDDVVLMVRELKKGGYHPEYYRVDTGIAMKKAIKDQAWDVILCDYKMPKFNAPSALTLLKEENIDIPVIIVSGTIGEEKAVECMRLGARDYIMKGTYSRLCPVIARELEETKIRRQHHLAEEQKSAALEELHQSEEKYRRITKCIPDLIWAMDMSGRFIYVNDAVERTHGWTVDEYLNLSLQELVSPPQLAKDTAMITEYLAKAHEPDFDHSSTLNFESEEIRKNGSTFLAEVTASFLWSDDGKPVGIIGITHDITERKRTEKILREKDEHLRGITENLPGVIFQFYAKDSGEYGLSYISKPVDEFAEVIPHLDTAKLDTVFDDFLSRICEEDRDPFVLSIAKAVQTVSRWNFEGRVSIPSGKMVWFQGLSIPTKLDDRVIFDGILLNINDRKLAEEISHKSQEKFHKIFMTTPDCIAITRLNDGLIIDVNKGFEDIMGWKRETAIGAKSNQHPINFWVHQSEHDLMLAELKSGKDVVHHEFTFRRSDGLERFGVYSARTITIDEQECVIFILKDITERKAIDAELQRTLEILRKSVGTTIQVMISAIEMRDPYTAGHQLRVSDIARTIATEMGLSQHTIDGIRMAGNIHDIGKLSIPSEILTKPSRLTPIEFALVQEHAQSGYEMLKNVDSPWPLAEIVYQHHERMDGSGYPRNLKGDAILIESRIMAVADVVEAMASHRPYRASLGIESALEEIEKNKGSLYDQDVVEICLKLFRKKGYTLP